MKTEPETKPAHSPEPWALVENYIVSVNAKPDSNAVCVMDEEWDAPQPNGQRIVHCVNALAGLNPEAVADVVAALESIDIGAIPYKRDMLIPQYAYKKVLAALAKLRQ
jgi:hypothetical protein